MLNVLLTQVNVVEAKELQILAGTPTPGIYFEVSTCCALCEVFCMNNVTVVSVQSADTYVKVSLMRQGKVVKSHKTQTVLGNAEPNFNESFQFRLSSKVSGAVSLAFLVTAAAGTGKSKNDNRVAPH